MDEKLNEEAFFAKKLLQQSVSFAEETPNLSFNREQILSDIRRKEANSSVVNSPLDRSVFLESPG